ncbi:MAG: Thiophene and furan oxidation protein [Firmicutes bacterium]|nr:Thiophene and furan oxidation protein [Bacillota bacterium]
MLLGFFEVWQPTCATTAHNAYGGGWADLKGEDTIAAIATGMGDAGVGVIRVSGPDAVALGERAFRPRRGSPLGSRRSHSMVYGVMIDASGATVDEGLAVVMRGPHSFTGEDVLELHCHGGQVAVRRVLDATLGAGARLAEPGEFTRRAFLHGRMDLAQAESVIDIIQAKTERAMDAAVHQLRGELSSAVREIRERLLAVSAHLEADIDFPELDLEVQTQDQVDAGCDWCLARIGGLLAGAHQGKLLREGLQVVLAGRTNVGKSSLLNRLVRENRAIVTEIPGTTRDVIAEWVNIRGLPVVLADTAGIRETKDVVEQLGVDRSRAMLERADLILLVVDAADGLTDEDRDLIALLPAGKPCFGIANKIDIGAGFDMVQLTEALGGGRVYPVSAQSGSGVDEVEEAIAGFAGVVDKEEFVLANARQAEALRRAAAHLEAAQATRRTGFGSDMISIDVRSAWVALGEITGESVGEDLLDQIFSRFCIGK